MEKLLTYLVKYRYSFLGLMIGYIILLLFFVFGFDNFLEKGIPDFSIRILIYLIMSVVWYLIWITIRNKMPVNKHDKIGIIICINSENDKQRDRIKNDFVAKLNQLLSENDFINLFNIVVLDDYQAVKAINIINRFFQIKNELNNIKSNKSYFYKIPKELKNWNTLDNKINGHFYVWGDIKERYDIEKKFFLNIEALVRHKPISPEMSAKFKKEFISVFPKEISFSKKIELRGFRTTANIIYFIARYIIGIAALISRDPFTAFKLHDGLKEELNKIKPTPPNLKHISEELTTLLSDELCNMSKYEYYINKDTKNAIKYIYKSYNMCKNHYSTLIFHSIITFAEERDPIKSLRLILKAKKFSNNDYTWLYNKAFLYMYLEKFEKGLKDYKKLATINFENEIFIVDQCVNFNKELIKNEPSKKQFLFILGFLYYRKKINLPESLDYFERFEEEAKDRIYSFLLIRARTYINEIKKEMNLID